MSFSVYKIPVCVLKHQSEFIKEEYTQAVMKLYVGAPSLEEALGLAKDILEENAFCVTYILSATSLDVEDIDEEDRELVSDEDILRLREEGGVAYGQYHLDQDDALNIFEVIVKIKNGSGEVLPAGAEGYGSVFLAAYDILEAVEKTKEHLAANDVELLEMFSATMPDVMSDALYEENDLFTREEILALYEDLDSYVTAFTIYSEEE